MSYVRGNPVFTGPAISALNAQNSCFWVTSSGSSSAWPAQYLAIYVPVVVPARTVVVKLGLINGSTASGNFDLGLYDAAGTRLVSTGSTAQSGTSTPQSVDVTDTTIGPGLYYLACCMDGTTGTTQNWGPAVPLALASGTLTQAVGSGTLPATATFAANQTLTQVPVLFALTTATAG